MQLASTLGELLLGTTFHGLCTIQTGTATQTSTVASADINCDITVAGNTGLYLQ